MENVVNMQGAILKMAFVVVWVKVKIILIAVLQNAEQMVDVQMESVDALGQENTRTARKFVVVDVKEENAVQKYASYFKKLLYAIISSP